MTSSDEASMTSGYASRPTTAAPIETRREP